MPELCHVDTFEPGQWSKQMRATNRTYRSVMSKLASAAILVSFLFTNVAIVGALANTPNVDATNSSAAFTTDLTQLGRQGRLRENPNFENEISALVEMLEKGG